MEITYTDFLRAKHDKEACENLKIVAADKKNPYNKMATQKHISAKRFKKLMMAVGLDRDKAQNTADRVGAFWNCYQTYFDDAKDELIWRIQNRTFEESLIALDSGTKRPHKTWMITNSAYVYDVIPKIRKKNEKEYNELVTIAEKYPDIMDEVQCKRLMDKTLMDASVSTGKKDENGNCIMKLEKSKSKETTAKIGELKKLCAYLEFRPYT